MDASRLLVFVFVVMSTFECSGSDTAELQCEDINNTIYLVEGEALYFVHDAPAESTLSNQELKWYKNNSRIEYISYDEKERIHLHGGAIFFLNVVPEDSGLYTARHEGQNGECNNYNVKVKVFEASERENPLLLYGRIDISNQNKKVCCPRPARETCIKFRGNYTWYKDYTLLQGRHEDDMWVMNSRKQDEGVYTCICTWRHNDRAYNTSGSRRLIVSDPFNPDVKILSPLNKEQFADESLELKLNCTVSCGRNVQLDDCTARWYVNGDQVNQMAGYNQTIKQNVEMPSKTTITTAILTIKKVSAKDFRAEFKCSGEGYYRVESATLTLKRRGSDTAELQCEDNNKTIYLVEGEALYFVHDAPAESTLSNQELKWYKNNTRIEYISYDEKERIHLHGGAIFFLNVVPEDSGLYTARHEGQNGECNNYNVKVKVFEASERENPLLLYGKIDISNQNKKVCCPRPAKETCIKFRGNYTWYKDYTLLQGRHEDNMWVMNSRKQDEGVYTCICTWRHNDRAYNTSGSRRLIVSDPFIPDVKILSPLNKEQFADESLELKLNCTVSCGRNVQLDDCKASWYVNGDQVNQMAGYNQTIKQNVEMPSKTTITTAILTIKKVSAKDFRAEFKCSGEGYYRVESATLTLKRRGSDTAELQCEDNNKTIYLVEGEALYFVHDAPAESTLSNQELKWYKNNTRIEYISYDEKERIHLHGGAIFFLNVVPEDSGLYTARHEGQNGECNNYNVKVKVFEASERENPLLLYGKIDISNQNKKVCCPRPAKETCIKFRGNYTWYKDYTLLQGRHEDNMWVMNSRKQDEGVYTCICTWRHNDRAYNTSGSRRLIVSDPFIPDVKILSPLNKEQFADESLELKLNCTVSCGRNVQLDDCKASWYVNGDQVNQMAGYNQTIKQNVEMPSKTTITTAILTIKKVSAKDFRAEFKCSGRGYYRVESATLTLKRRASITSLVITAVCVLLVCVFAAVLVKCFAVDLALLFRPCFHLRSHKKDARMYDAYVVYQMQTMDKYTENTLCQFITQVLPSVLEEKCGYRLFIQGRDDIPGEDHMELVENNMKQSRRLMVILTPGSGSHSEMTDQHPDSLCDSVIGGFDWQVGLHHALVQREMSVILIQLGDTGPQGYTHLPIGLQHLIRKSAPLRWPEVSRNAAGRNSRFWKRVRYLMPATPAKRCPQSALI